MYATLQRSGGVEAVARRLSISTPRADRLTATLLPLVLGGLRRHLAQAADPAAAVLALEDMLEAFGGARMATAVLGQNDYDHAAGDALVAEVLGHATTRTAVIAYVRRETGLSAEHVATALTLVMMMAAGYVAARIATAEEIDATVVAEVARLVDMQAPTNPLDTLA